MSLCFCEWVKRWVKIPSLRRGFCRTFQQSSLVKMLSSKKKSDSCHEKRAMEEKELSEELLTCASCLGRLPPVLECIMNQLPMKDLNSCMRVSKLWNKVGKSVKKRRTDIFWYCELLIDQESDVPEYSENVMKLSPLEESLSVKNKSDVKIRLTKTLRNARSQPKLALLFVNQRISQFFNSNSNKRFHSLSDHLVSLLPKNCLGLGALSYHGVIGTVNGGQLVEAEVVDGISALFLPQIPGVEFCPFLIGSSHRNLSSSTIDDEILTHITNIDHEKNIKCLLLFSSDYCGRDTSLVAAIVSKLLARQPRGFAVAGGYLQNILALQGLCGINQKRDKRKSKVETLGIAICGDNVEAASVIVDGEIESVEKALLKLKTCKFSEDNLVGLMFACCSRGKDFYNKNNVEADLFRKTFPTTPLFGFFGSGEIGLQKIPNNSPAFKRHKIDISNIDMVHSYTTVFVLLSFKSGY